MSQKRKHTESTSAGQESKGFTKKQRSEPASGGARFNPYRRPKAEPKANSTNKIKSRIRDLKRLLGHADNVPKHKMSATQRVERERELETCEHELAEKIAAGREAAYRNKMISRYHQIRFFDRRKAERNLKKLKRELSSLDPNSENPDLLRRIDDAEVDLNYAIYYPLLKPYSSLYPNTKQEKGKTDETTDSEDLQGQPQETGGPKGDHEMWRAVRAAMKNGTLQDLRSSRPEETSHGAKEEQKVKLEQKAKKGDKKKNTKKDQKNEQSSKSQKSEGTNAGQNDEEDEGSDDGFWA